MQRLGRRLTKRKITVAIRPWYFKSVMNHHITLSKIIKETGDSVPYELTSEHSQFRVDIFRQFMENSTESDLSKFGADKKYTTVNSGTRK